MRIPETAEAFGERASGRSWIIGLLIPAGLVWYGARALASESFTIYGRGGTWTVEGATASCFAVVLISAGAALHFHGIWSATKSLFPFSEIGKLLAMIVLVISMGRGIYLFFMT